MQEKIMLLCEEFIYKNISKDFIINQNENMNFKLNLM